MSKTIIGVMGPGEDASPEVARAARELGVRIASEGWVLLCGGRASGVMEAVAAGAREGGGLTIGVLPESTAGGVADGVDVAIVTGMGSARNNINVLSSSVVVGCGMGSGTASEIALALKAKRPVVLLHAGAAAEAFYRELAPKLVTVVSTPEEAVARTRELLRN